MLEIIKVRGDKITKLPRSFLNPWGPREIYIAQERKAIALKRRERQEKLDRERQAERDQLELEMAKYEEDRRVKMYTCYSIMGVVIWFIWYYNY